MIVNSGLQWTLSLVFIATGAYSVFWTARSIGWRPRVSYGAHFLMSAAMLAMVWPWGVRLLLVPQIVVFTLATLWFLYLFATRRATAATSPTNSSHHDGGRALAYHAGMMAAMVVMAAGMTGMSVSTTASGAGSMASMPGMDMSGTSGANVSMPLWVGLASLTLAIAFGIATIYFVGSLLASATAEGASPADRRGRSSAAAWNGLMAAGMAALFVPMVSFG